MGDDGSWLRKIIFEVHIFVNNLAKIIIIMIMVINNK